MTLNDLITHPVGTQYLTVALVMLAVVVFCLVVAVLIGPDRGLIALSAIAGVAGLACVLAVGAYWVNLRDSRHDLATATATYVREHNQLTAMEPIILGATGAKFDAARANGDTVHVHVTWSTGKTVDGTPAPSGFNPISVTVTG